MNKVFAFIAAFSLTALASAQENPTWIRKNAISPDGSTIAFSYKGDIYTVPVRGGQAHQVTTNAAYESEPVWTHDGKHILFSSYREDTKDIYMTTPEGGTPKQLTSFPGNETPLTVLPDGKVLFTAYNQNLMSEGFPTMILVSFFIISVLMPNLCEYFSHSFDGAFTALERLYASIATGGRP